jgi:hypothetical protein
MEKPTANRTMKLVRRLAFVSAASLALAGVPAHADSSDQSCADLETARQSGITRENNRTDASDQKISDSNQASQQCMLDFGVGGGNSIGLGSTVDSVLSSLVKSVQSTACGALSSRTVPNLSQAAQSATSSATSTATSAANSALTSATGSTATSSSSSGGLSAMWSKLASTLGL